MCRLVGCDATGHLHAGQAGAILMQPKTVRHVRVGSLGGGSGGSTGFWRGYQVAERYGTTFGIDQGMLDRIHTQGSTSIGGDSFVSPEALLPCWLEGVLPCLSREEESREVACLGKRD